MRIRCCHATRGLTLVEILIAIGIFSLVVAAIYSCWSAVLRSSKVGLDAAARAQRSRMALQTVEEALTYAKMYAANADLYWFEGRSGSDARLSFVAKVPRSFPRGGKFGDLTLRRMEFSLEQGDDHTDQMVLRQAPLLEEFDVDEKNYPLVLARDVDQMIIEFWNALDEDWIDEWTETNRIPDLVRVSLITTRGTGQNSRKVESTAVINPASHAVQAASQGMAPPSRRERLEQIRSGLVPGGPGGSAPSQPIPQPGVPR